MIVSRIPKRHYDFDTDDKKHIILLNLRSIEKNTLLVE